MQQPFCWSQVVGIKLLHRPSDKTTNDMKRKTTTLFVFLLCLVSMSAIAQRRGPDTVEPALLTTIKTQGTGSLIRQSSALSADSATAISARAEAEVSGKLTHAKQFIRNNSARIVTPQDFVGETPAPELIGEKFSATKSTLQPTLRRAPRLAPGNAKTGQYMSNDSSYAYGNIGFKMQCYHDSATGQYYMVNAHGLETDTIRMDVDTTNGTVTIKPQIIYKTRSNDFYIYTFNYAKKLYNTTQPITGSVDKNGVITLGEWGIFAPSDDGNAQALDIIASSTWRPYEDNASYVNCTNSRRLSTVKYPVIVEQTGEKQVRLVNFANTGYTVTGRLTSDHRVIVAPQRVGTNYYYGDLYVFAATDSVANRTNEQANIVGTLKDGKLYFGPWLTYYRASSRRLLGTRHGEITLVDSITWPAATTVTFEGTGTATDPYLLKTAEDIEALSEKVEGGDAYTGSHFKVANDIDLSSVKTHVPIGTSDIPFAGEVDGAGHTLSNLTYNDNGAYNAGLFGVTDSVSVIKNLKISNFTITGPGSFVGIVAGQMHGTIDSVEVTASTINVTGAYVGGLTGYTFGPIRNSSFQGTIIGYGSEGGLAGYSHNEIVNSHAVANLGMSNLVSTSNNDIAGLVAYMSPTEYNAAKIVDSWYSGQIIDRTGASNAAGLVSILNGGSVERSFNVGSITTSVASGSSDHYTGGIVAVSMDSKYKDCFNAGTIVKSGSSNGVGGLVGYIGMVTINGEPGEYSYFNNCYNSGYIVSSPTSYSDHRGIWGSEGVLNGYHPTDVAFTNCYTDIQATAMKDTVNGISNAELLSGTLPSGFSSNVWTAKAGQYPVLKEFDGTAASNLAAAGLAFAASDNAGKVKKAVTIGAESGITTKLYNSASKELVNQTNYFTIANGKISPRSSFGSDIVETYVNDDAYQVKLTVLAAVPKVFDGEGTAASPYLIKNKTDLETLNNAVYNAQQPFQDDYFLMTNDIDADGFGGIGVGEKAGQTFAFFQGDFNGGGHTISGLKVASYEVGKSSTGEDSLLTSSEYYYAGLFRIVGRYGHIHNLTIGANNSFDIYEYGGAVAGYLEGRIDNVVNLAAVNGYSGNIGGIVGQVTELGSVSHCYNGGNVTTADQRIGGIVGRNSGKIEYCENDGDVTSDNYEKHDGKSLSAFGMIGGIAGYTEGPLTGNVNAGTIKSSQYAGGIAGRMTNTSLNGNLNTGFVALTKTTEYTGGLVGDNRNDNTFEGNAYEASINVNGSVQGSEKAGVTAASTAALISGTALNGLQNDSISYTAGQYPVLKQFASISRAQTLRKVYIRFAEGEQVNDIRGKEALANVNGLTWSLLKGTDYSISGDTLSVSPTSTEQLATDTLTAAIGDVKKVYYLTAIPKILPGDGTVEAPFQIKTKADMDKIADFVTATGTSFPNYYFQLLNDIDYDSAAIKPIAIGGNSFNADFDGGGHTISNFTFTYANSRTGDHNGLFGTVGSNGYVHDLTLNGTMNFYRFSGSFVGLLYGKLRNVTNLGTITASQSSAYCGGIVGDVQDGALVDSVFNYASFNISGSHSYIGGIAGRMFNGGVISNSGNTGDITSTRPVAGVVAYMSNGGKVLRSYNTGNITSTGSDVAGIVAEIYRKATFTIDSCWNSGNIEGSTNVGGILGATGNGNTATLSRSWNTGNVSATKNVGGIAGSIDSGVDIDSVYNTGTVTSDNGYAAGIAASLESGYDETPMTVKNCWNTGKITGASKAGGLFADVSGSSDSFYPHINDCWNTGDVTGTGSGTTNAIGYGGIAGSGDGIMTGCWNAGTITSKSLGTGGLAGYGSATQNDCFNVGDVSSSYSDDTNRAPAGGLQGFGDGLFHNSYNMGTVSGSVKIGGIDGSAFWSLIMENVYNAGRLNAENDNVEKGNFNNDPGHDFDTIYVANLYYAKDISPKTDIDDTLQAKGLTSPELFNATGLGDHYKFVRAAYPTLKAIKEPAVGNFYAAQVLFLQGEDSLHIRSPFYVGQLDSVTWTSSDNIAISDHGIAQGMKEGAGWVKKTTTFHGKTYERTYNLNVEVATGIRNVNVDDEADGLDVTKPMYNLAGQRVSRTYRGVVVQRGKKYIKK